jgi:hypothetical protein
MFVGDGEVITCSCGRVWELRKQNKVQRDPVSIDCTCGQTLYKWEGAIFYTKRLVGEFPEDERPSEPLPG